MFKSIFVKYVTAFMVIILASILVSTSLIATVLNLYDGNSKNRSLTNMASGAVSYLSREYNSNHYDSFREYVAANDRNVDSFFDSLNSTIDNVVVYLLDTDGEVIYHNENNVRGEFSDVVGDGLNEPVLLNIMLSENLLKELDETESIVRSDRLNGQFTEKKRYAISSVRDESGNNVGYILSCIMKSNMDNLISSMIRTIVISTLWLMLAALVAVYFITERLVSPLRSMSRAAKEFAEGHFDVRVPVSGEDEVSDLAEAFNNMASTLQRSEETRRLFLANVSHDLRTPMTTISGFIDSILSGVIPRDDVPHYLEVISSEVKRLSRLVSSLLDITKIQAGERKFTMEPFDICELAREIIIASEQRLEEKKLDVEFDADKDNIYVLADKDAIHQVLYNICDNGIKFSHEGAKYIVNIKETRQNLITVSVYNEGIGISKEDIPLVFDRFYKSDRSRGLDKTGSGLGLYISKTIIEAHKQRIYVESEFGKWTRFSFTLQKTDSQKHKDERKYS